MDALELTMKCSKLLKKPYSTTVNEDLPLNSQAFSTPPTVLTINHADSSLLSTSFSDTDFDLSRLSAKEEDDRMSEVGVDISKASRSASSHSESSQDNLNNDDDDATPYIAAAPEEFGEVK